MRDAIAFLKQWSAAPLQVASVTPSGRSLARLMTEHLSPKTGPVIELGPGTGVFTRAMIERGVPEEKIAMIELNPIFAEELRNRFPRAQVHCISAGDIHGADFFGEKAGSVVSGLGLLSMPPELNEAIMRGVFHHLKPGGAFVQFTYGPRCPVKAPLREKLGLVATKTGRTLANLPPASVYHLKRQADTMSSTAH